MSAPTYDLGKLHGGLRLQGHKQESTTRGILDIPVPSQLVLPIEQHVGEPAQPVVELTYESGVNVVDLIDGLHTTSTFRLFTPTDEPDTDSATSEQPPAY